jgi:hypothetical protein
MDRHLVDIVITLAKEWERGPMTMAWNSDKYTAWRERAVNMIVEHFKLRLTGWIIR